MNWNLYLLLLFHFSCSHSLTLDFTEGNERKSVSFASPSVEITGTPVPFFVSTAQIWLPTDGNDGCEASAFSGASGKVALVNSYTCSYAEKIRNAFGSGTVGLIIQWTEETDPGYNYKWAGLGISEEEGVDLPTVEVLFNVGEYIVKKVKEDPENTTVSYTNGDANKWKDVYESATFIILFQGLLSSLYLLVLAYTVFKFARVSLYKIKKKKSSMQVFIKETTSWINYLTIVGCVCAILYLAIDPIHSRGVYNSLADRIFLTISFPSSFISTFLVAFALHSALNAESKLSVDVHLRTIVGFLVIGGLLFSLDILISSLQGTYIVNERDPFVQYGAGAVYFLFPFAVIIFLLATVRRYRKITENSNGVSKSAGSIKLAHKLVVVSWILSALYTLWLLAVGMGITRFSITAYGRVTFFWLYFVIGALIKFAHVSYLPDPTSRDNSGRLCI